MRDPREGALNELRRRCLEAAELYEQAEERASDPGVEALFASLAGRRRLQSSWLEQRIAALGALPEDVDPEVQVLRKLVTAVRTWLSTEENDALLAERERTELRILDAAEDALEEELAPDSRQLVERIHREVTAAGELLARARSGADI